MGEGGDNESPVAPRGAVPDRVLLEDDDIPPWIVALRMKSGPEAGEAAADEAEVRVGRAHERGIGLAGREIRQPVGDGHSIGVCSALRLRRCRVGPGKSHASNLPPPPEPTGSVSLERASSSAG